MKKTTYTPSSTFATTILLNGATDAPSTGFLHGDPLFHDRRTALDLTADSIEDALLLAVNVGTRTGADTEGRQWCDRIRTMNVGDVVHLARALVNKDGAIKEWQEEGYFAVNHGGFTHLSDNPGGTYGFAGMSVTNTVGLAA